METSTVTRNGKAYAAELIGKGIEEDIEALLNLCNFPADFNLETHPHNYPGLVAYARETPNGSPEFFELRGSVKQREALCDRLNERAANESRN